MDRTAAIKEYIDLEVSVLQKTDARAVNALMELLDETRKRGATVYVMGNGGSAATASHFANDFNKGVSERLDPPFRFVCLNDNVATLTAIANDIGYDTVFEFQLRGRVRREDVLLCISGSGNSPNVIKAAKFAKSVGATVVGLTGFAGGELRRIADVSLHVPVTSMQIAEDAHMMFDHLMMAVFCKTLRGIDHVKGEAG
ncbi:MAG: SIS domain-containing protein [Clostridiales Family XIII bacterium]|jgi:D-sedoheptulose 7-phosphate isomerase|nr:SIS domain-containing protein [Clostridiales Family XIII bacterium]